ncbi:ataxin-7-like protein 2 [Ornithorhynchus anatinus]|uniref:ataxin-7-like protein 2 n=1 Tax=Ornithorhynchus anatinus TaxID=9258 RepID=UPI0010A8CC36|nr:ataxin-7-like protein 2 [Ornithorhynchus anatinus]
MAVRERAAAAMAALERRVPSLDDFAGQSWSSWVERADLAAADGSELEECHKNGKKKLDAMTLIKEDMSIFGHCPAHDEFYLVVCNHCSQVVKPQAFQKHCERRHGPLSKLYARAQASAGSQKCHTVNGQGPACGSQTQGSSSKSSREKAQGSRSRAHPAPEKAQKDNLCLYVPVVNLEKISSLSKPSAAPSVFLGQPGTPSKDPPGKAPVAPFSSKEPSGKGGSPPGAGEGPSPRAESSPAEKESGGTRLPPKAHKKMARKECDLNRQCGVLNPETKKICTRLLTCKIHSVHQRREVQGRAKDFDVLVAELKASSRKGESPKEKSPPAKELGPERLPQEPLPTAQPAGPPVGTFPSRVKQLHPSCGLPRSRLSSESELDDAGPCSGDRDPGLFPFPLPRAGGPVSSDESEEEAVPEDPHRPPDCHYATRPPRPQAYCTFGSRLVSPGCYVFNRRLDRFCSALSSMLERHLSSHMWKKIPPAAEPPAHPADSPLAVPLNASPGGGCPRSAGSAHRPSCPPPAKDNPTLPAPGYPAGSPSVAAACSQAECTGGSQSITSPLPANTPSPSFSKLPPSKASRPPKGREGTEAEAPPRKRKPPPAPADGPTAFKRTCLLEPPGKGKPTGCRALPPKTKPALGVGLNGAVGPRVKRVGPLDCRGPPHPPPAPGRASQLENRGGSGPPAKAPQPNGLSEEEEAKKQKNLATYCRPAKPKHCPVGPPGDSICSVRRKKPGPALGFEEKCTTLKSKAH